MHIASRITFFRLDEERTLENGRPVIVKAISFNNSTSTVRSVVMKDNDDNLLGIVTVPSQDCQYWDVEFIADNGISFVSMPTDKDCTVTIFHCYAGG